MDEGVEWMREQRAKAQQRQMDAFARWQNAKRTSENAERDYYEAKAEEREWRERLPIGLSDSLEQWQLG